MPSKCGAPGCKKWGSIQGRLPGSDKNSYYCSAGHMESAGAVWTESNKKMRDKHNKQLLRLRTGVQKKGRGGRKAAAGSRPPDRRRAEGVNSRRATRLGAPASSGATASAPASSGAPASPAEPQPSETPGTGKAGAKTIVKSKRQSASEAKAVGKATAKIASDVPGDAKMQSTAKQQDTCNGMPSNTSNGLSQSEGQLQGKGAAKGMGWLGMAPGIKNTWTSEEDQILITAQKMHGNAFSKIAKVLPGRTLAAIKKRWHGCLKPNDPNYGEGKRGGKRSGVGVAVADENDPKDWMRDMTTKTRIVGRDWAPLTPATSSGSSPPPPPPPPDSSALVPPPPVPAGVQHLLSVFYPALPQTDCRWTDSVDALR